MAGISGDAATVARLPAVVSEAYSMNSRASSCRPLYGLMPQDQESVGVTGRPPSKYGCGAVPQANSFSPAKEPRFHGPPTKNGTLPEVKKEASWNEVTPRGERPSANRSWYQRIARTQPSVVTAGESMSSPVMPEPPPRDSTSGCRP